jgi:hypothetical protein
MKDKIIVKIKRWDVLVKEFGLNALNEELNQILPENRHIILSEDSYWTTNTGMLIYIKPELICDSSHIRIKLKSWADMVCEFGHFHVSHLLLDTRCKISPDIYSLAADRELDVYIDENREFFITKKPPYARISTDAIEKYISFNSLACELVYKEDENDL